MRRFGLEHSKARPQSKILVTTPFLTNSLKFLGKLSPCDQNTGAGPLVVFKSTYYSSPVKMLF